MSSNSTYVTVPSSFTLTGVTQDASNNVVFPAGIQMPNAAASTSSFGVVFGPATASGTKLVRNTSSTLQSILADGSANARLAGNLFNSTNDQGLGSPNFVLGTITTYGLYMTATGPYVGFAANGNWGCRTNSSGQTNVRSPVVRTQSGSVTVAHTDTGVIYENWSASAQVTYNLPAPSAVAGSTWTFVNATTSTTFVKIVAPTGVALNYLGANGTNAGSLTSASAGASIVVAQGFGTLYYLTMGASGSWTLV